MTDQPAAPRAPDQAALLEAALAYARRGWPVFPCNPKNKQPLLAAKKDGEGNKIQGTGGVSAASIDEAQIRTWWKKWPKALVGLATGHPTVRDAHGHELLPPHKRLFVLDFDPRNDESTGEVWTLQQLKRDTENQIGCTLPESLTAMTPSDGVHLYLLQGDDGEPITNRGNLPQHVDVRGLGGYVIAPPSIMAPDAAKGQGGLRYRWHRREPAGGMADAPSKLLIVLRDRAGQRPKADPSPRPAAPIPAGPGVSVTADEAVRKYALTALDGECAAMRSAVEGQRNNQLNISALKLASLVAAGALDANVARFSLEAAARDCGLDAAEIQATIDSGWNAGMASPRDLRDIEAAARDRAAGRRVGGNSAGFRHGSPAPSSRRDRGGGAADRQRPAELTPADKARLNAIAEAWLDKRIERMDRTADALKAVAWGAGRRIAAGQLDEHETKEALWQALEKVADATMDDVDRSLAGGIARGFDPWPTLLDLKCGGYPLTDFGIGERFRDRFGDDFRFTTAKGWLGWDGRRWKVLDQDKDSPPAEIIGAVFETVRAIQREAKRIRETDVRLKLISKGKEHQLADEDPNQHALDYWVISGRTVKKYSQLLAEFGRKSETAGKPAAIAALAHRWLTVPIEHFDCEQMAVNVMNGTLRLGVETMPDGKRMARARLDPHRREDFITRLAPVDYDQQAQCQLYDGMFAWAQPDPAVRRYLHQVGGYACSGDTGEHKLWFNYGRGRNGKSTTIDAWCSTLGDYAGTIGIESFLDQGIKKRGDAATPDLAKLGGVRMLRASEPERGAKLNSALIKAATGGEPMSVRALHRGFFDLLPRFKLLMSGNSKPQIPDTDDGIWTRMKLVDWGRNIDLPDEDPFVDRFPVPPDQWPAKDPKLLDKIKANELPGIFRRLIDGLCDYLENGFVEPASVTIATEDYRDKSDPLARFLRLCTETDTAERVKSSELHDVYKAWCKAAGVKEWTPNGFAEAMMDKGFLKTRSDGMRWIGLKLTRKASDFVDHEGNVLPNLPDLDDTRLSTGTARPPGAAPPPSDDWNGLDDDVPHV